MGKVQRVSEKTQILNIEYRNRRKNSIFNIQYRRNKSCYTEKEAQRKAAYLADKFGNPSGLAFYLKCAWNLTDQYIDWLADYSLKKDSPARYFVSVASKKMLEITHDALPTNAI